jgi:hypothetical protein
MADLTTGQQKLADQVAELLANAPLPPDITQQILDNLQNLPEQSLAELVRWLSDRNMAVAELEAALVSLQEKHEAEWQALEKQQQHDVDAILADEMATAAGRTPGDDALAAADEQ